MKRTFTFREIGRLTHVLQIFLWLGVLMSVVSIISSVMEISLLSQPTFSKAEGEANDRRERIVVFTQWAVYLVTAIIFGMWIVRANRNVRAWGVTDLPITPGWALGYFFVPVICLWRPYQAMKDLWRASHQPESWATAPVDSVVKIWWTLWIFCFLVSKAVSQKVAAAKTLEQIQSANYGEVLGEAFSIFLSLVAILLVSHIAGAQMTRVESQVSGNPDVPPIVPAETASV